MAEMPPARRRRPAVRDKHRLEAEPDIIGGAGPSTSTVIRGLFGLPHPCSQPKSLSTTGDSTTCVTIISVAAISVAFQQELRNGVLRRHAERNRHPIVGEAQHATRIHRAGRPPQRKVDRVHRLEMG